MGLPGLPGIALRSTARALMIGFALSSPALAGADLRVDLRDQNGEPVADAVVSVTPLSPDVAVPVRAPALTKSIDQRNEAFVPFLEIFRPGDRLVFHNNDDTRHHVYSFSPIKSFEFVLAKGETSAPIELDKAGVFAVGCNIHDAMIAYVYISDAPWIGRSDQRGIVRIDGLPPGAFSVSVWHAWQELGKEQPPRRITIDPVVTSVGAEFTLSLVPDRREPGNLERSTY